MTEWRPVPGYEGIYEVSDDGRFRNIHPTGGRPAGYVRATPLHRTSGRPIVRLYGPEGGKTLLAHRLVARAFLGEPPRPRARVRMVNGDRTDLRAANLEWVAP